MLNTYDVVAEIASTNVVLHHGLDRIASDKPLKNADALIEKEVRNVIGKRLAFTEYELVLKRTKQRLRGMWIQLQNPYLHRGIKFSYTTPYNEQDIDPTVIDVPSKYSTIRFYVELSMPGIWSVTCLNKTFSSRALMVDYLAKVCAAL